MKPSVRALAAAALLAAAAVPSSAHAQLGGMIRDAVNSKIQEKVNSAVDCVFSDLACIKAAQDSGKQITVTDSSGKAVKNQAAAKTKAIKSADSAVASGGLSTGAAAAGAAETSGAATDAAAPSEPPGKGAWLNYDFIPGDTVIFFDDFSKDNVGDLPAHEDIDGGNVTVVDIQGKKYLRTSNGGQMTVTLPEALPQRFTIEFTYHRKGGNGSGLQVDIDDLKFRCDQGNATVYGTGPNGAKESGEEVPINEDSFETCRLMVDGGYAKIYVDSVRVGQLNGLTFARTNKIVVELANADDNGMLLTDFRVAAGGKQMFDALTADGRVATHGILFNTGSDQIRGESTPTLKEIGDMLTQHADLHLTIEGHTDNTGTVAGNQTLSEKRAASVRQYLIDNYRVEGARLKSVGYGQTKPVASNDTAEGRQNNRRVELVKN
ncbi:MAG TPA: OmpA family protein [Gemmatimonadales bacterium]|jgi:outer membrane protein OmpA-like peptidoglycan-associated protein|nr:OmpA family protein [Gemmatimonadales bacterium]